MIFRSSKRGKNFGVLFFMPLKDFVTNKVSETICKDTKLYLKLSFQIQCHFYPKIPETEINTSALISI